MGFWLGHSALNWSDLILGGIQGAQALNFFLAMPWLLMIFILLARLLAGDIPKSLQWQKLLMNSLKESSVCVGSKGMKMSLDFGYFSLSFSVWFVWSFELHSLTVNSHFSFFSVDLILPNRSHFFLAYDQTVLMGLGGLILGYNSGYKVWSFVFRYRWAQKYF